MTQAVNPTITLLALTIAAASIPVAAADDSVDANTLITENCSSCHGSEIYTRNDRRVTSLDGLHRQVRMCEQNLGLTWFDDQVDEVTALLNKDYYRFDR